MKTMLGAMFAVAAIYVAWLAGTGRALPFGLQAGAAVWVVLGLGMTGCALGPLTSIASGGSWTSPMALFGIVAGVAALVAVWALATGATLGVVSEPRQMMFVLAGVIGAKVLAAAATALATVGTVVAKG